MMFREAIFFRKEFIAAVVTGKSRSYGVPLLLRSNRIGDRKTCLVHYPAVDFVQGTVKRFKFASPDKKQMCEESKKNLPIGSSPNCSATSLIYHKWLKGVGL